MQQTADLPSIYESKDILHQYLLFHYGNAEEQLPYDFGPHEALNFPVRCVEESLAGLEFPPQASALDIGCAVGRASFELARFFKNVTAIDNSKLFIETAKQLQVKKKIVYKAFEEGGRYSDLTADIPVQTDTSRVCFRCLNAEELFKEEQMFDFVLAANVICRMPEPRSFLEAIHRLVHPAGVFALASPYSWLEEFTPRQNWLGCKEKDSFEEIGEILTPHFTLMRAFDLPFLIREHARKYQWGVSQLSLWKKQAVS